MRTLGDAGVRAAVVLVEIARVERLLRLHEARFLARAFTVEEREACFRRRDPARHLAARLAAKLAARRALGSPGFPLRSLNVSASRDGAPRLDITPPPAASTFLSLSHDGGMAAAAVVFEGAPE
ncbi:MAG: 4'-phosphopantetheinyl transferase superfamily protein [Deltaproteobacteria bacterium]|nr:4'-phosphopantetheinyl transferase superfamily protein [Deltaproteobacteria bacterium]